VRLRSRSKSTRSSNIFPGPIGDCIKENGAALEMEIEEESWHWLTYLGHYEDMKVRHESVISDYNGNRKGTIGLNDLTIIALAKTLGLPVISRRKRTSIRRATSERRFLTSATR
jgi:hypothetical protein